MIYDLLNLFPESKLTGIQPKKFSDNIALMFGIEVT